MMVDWDFIFMIVSVLLFLVWVYYMTVINAGAGYTGPGCSGNCQQGRLPCDCDLNKKDQV